MLSFFHHSRRLLLTTDKNPIMARNLLVKFKDDLIDEALTLTQVLSKNSASSTTVDLSHAAWRSWASVATSEYCFQQFVPDKKKSIQQFVH